MLNPLKVILHQEYHTSIPITEENIDIEDYYIDSSHKMNQSIIKSNDDFIEFEKSVFKQVANNSKDINSSFLDILTRKATSHNNTMVNFVQTDSTKLSKFLLSYSKNTDEQIRVIRAMFGRSQYAILASSSVSSDGIGFKSIDLFTLQDCQESLHHFSKHWKSDTKLDANVIVSRLDKQYTSKVVLKQTMINSIDWYFKKNTAYKAKAYVSIYEDMNKDLQRMLKKQNEQHEKITQYYTEAIEDYSHEFKKEIERYYKIEAIPPHEAEKRIEILKHNYQILIDSLVYIENMIAYFFNLQKKIILISYKHYKDVIQSIYDGCIEEL